MRWRVLVSGRVQGVGFRASCARQAQLRGLSGWVRNLPDGRVEAELQGRREAVAAVADWCRQGPALARVQHVDIAELPALDANDGFRVT